MRPCGDTVCRWILDSFPALLISKQELLIQYLGEDSPLIISVGCYFFFFSLFCFVIKFIWGWTKKYLLEQGFFFSLFCFVIKFIWGWTKKYLLEQGFFFSLFCFVIKFIWGWTKKYLLEQVFFFFSLFCFVIKFIWGWTKKYLLEQGLNLRPLDYHSTSWEKKEKNIANIIIIIINNIYRAPFTKVTKRCTITTNKHKL